MSLPGAARRSPPARKGRSGQLRAAALFLLFAAAGSWTEAAGPDRALYEEAQKARASLQKSTGRQSRKTEWERVVLAYRRLVARHPRSPYCDNALMIVGDLYRQMAARFGGPRYGDDAVHAYRTLVAEYPSSSLCEPALFAAFEILRQTASDKQWLEAGRHYLKAYPRGAHAQQVEELSRRGPAREAAAAPAGELTQVNNLRFWSGASSTRVVLDLERQVKIKYDRIGDPDRLWVDLLGTRLRPGLGEKQFPVGDGLLEQIRIGPNREGVVRVVLDFKSVGDHNLFYLHDPPRLVVDVRGREPVEALGVTLAGPAVPGPEAPPQAVPIGSATPPPPSAAEVADAPTPSPAHPEPSPTPRPRAEPTPADEPRVADAAPAGTPAPSPPEPPRANRGGDRSLARQLGLGARRIVIDPGHGGHDPGCIGPGGLQEKDLVLDVAVRLAELMERDLGAEVLLTRSVDTFIPLEERTAIANSRGADLFLSIHANSSRSRAARGVETYYLSFATDPDAEAVAARENAISEATLKDLQSLVRAIAMNSKIDESRDFAASVHEAMLAGLKPIHNRGVRTAPFYVLIGANMPSVLAEISFLSHAGEEKLLRSSDHRQRIAHSLLAGVHHYLEALSPTQTRRLTASSRESRVPSGGGSRR